MAQRPLTTDKFLVAPSILSADFSKLAEEIRAVEEAGADWIHVDVMDGHFVPNLTIGAPVIKKLRPVTKAVMDVHLMIEKPEKFIDDFIKAGSDILTIHVESTKDPKSLLQHIRKANVRPGITMRPGTPVSEVIPYLPLVDLVLVMTVEPGFGGQSFMHDQIQKITELRKQIEILKRQIWIEVDGGINADTAKLCRDADVLVAGNYVFTNSYANAIRQLQNAKSVG